MILTPEQAYRHAYKNGLKFSKDQMISEHFGWYEVFKNQEDEAVPSIVIFYNAKKMADELEKRRKASGKSFNIHRWYSSPRYNKVVVYNNAKNADGSDKGANSLHCLALAVDGDESGLNPEQSRVEVNNMVNQDKIRVRIERGTATWIHMDVGHPYIPNGMKFGLFYP